MTRTPLVRSTLLRRILRAIFAAALHLGLLASATAWSWRAYRRGARRRGRARLTPRSA